MKAKLFIDGAWHDPLAGRTFPTINPATEEPIREVARADASDVDRAAQAAHQAMSGPWRDMAPAERGAILFRLADAIAAAREELALLETTDMGKPLRDARGDIDGVCETLIYNAGAADKMEGATIPLGPEFVDFTLLEPQGVTGHIVPWNFPLGMAMRSVAPALAAGCTVVLKPAEQSPLSALRLAEIAAETGLPEGVLNVVTGFGEEAGEALVRHPLVRGITFTGSVETGRKIMAAAALGTKPVVLELGGKNPMLVFPDADLERAVADAVDGAFGNCGQVCSSSAHLVLHESIAEPFLQGFEEAASRLKVGPGMEDPDLGPLVSAEQHAKVLGTLEHGTQAGARLRLGGKRPAHLDHGYFLEPTLLDQVPPACALAREEVFGPVAIATTFAREDEALELANGLGYGLVAGIYDRDVGRALRLARRIETGSVWINGWFIGGVQAPTGGIKDSGIGRERGLPGIHNYLQIKNIGIRL
ncbi:MAG: aldehyde dehydrogenase family protein [Pseudomonadota bacterium]